MTQKYQVLSPDNIPINMDGAIYRSRKQAIKELLEWTKNYEAQGYYSQVCYNGYVRHIPVNEIADYCFIREIN